MLSVHEELKSFDELSKRLTEFEKKPYICTDIHKALQIYSVSSKMYIEEFQWYIEVFGDWLRLHSWREEFQDFFQGKAPNKRKL